MYDRFLSGSFRKYIKIQKIRRIKRENLKEMQIRWISKIKSFYVVGRFHYSYDY